MFQIKENSQWCFWYSVQPTHVNRGGFNAGIEPTEECGGVVTHPVLECIYIMNKTYNSTTVFISDTDKNSNE